MPAGIVPVTSFNDSLPSFTPERLFTYAFSPLGSVHAWVSAKVITPMSLMVKVFVSPLSVEGTNFMA